MVRTIGGAATADGDATADGLGALEAMPGEGAGRGRKRASLAVSVGGTPGGVAGASLPGRAPCIGRSLAGAQLATANPASTASASATTPRWRPEDCIGLSLSSWTQNLKNNSDTADDQDMPTGLNRALQVRTADRLRAELVRDEATRLPIVGSLSEVDRRELCDVGGGRVVAVAICVDAWAPFEMELHVLHDDSERALIMREVARLVDENVRRTDLLGWLSAETLIVLAPGIDAVGGRSLAARLHAQLAASHVEIAGIPLELRVRVGCASRSHASPSTWTLSALGAEAELQASEPLSVATVA